MMTPSERLKEIEEKHAFKVVSKIQGRSSEHLEISSADIEWLIERVKLLLMALEDANDLCRSAYQIAERKGSANWPAFTERLKESLSRQFKVLVEE